MTETVVNLPQKKVFNALFQVVVHLYMDLAYDKKAAQQSYLWLKKNKEHLEGVIDDLEVFTRRGVGGVQEGEGKTFWRAYNKMMEDIVLDYDSDLVPTHDFYGACAFENPTTKQKYLVGDSYDMYALYDYESLQKYLKENL